MLKFYHISSVFFTAAVLFTCSAFSAPSPVSASESTGSLTDYTSEYAQEEYVPAIPDDFALSEEQLSYTMGLGTLRVGYVDDNPPFQYKNKDGTPKGITIDFLNYISEQTHLVFELVPAESEKELEEMSAGKKIDLVAGITNDNNCAQRLGVVMTSPYVSAQYMVMINQNIPEEDLRGKHLALPRTIYYEGYYVGDVRQYDTQKDCINAVNSGDADYTYADSYIAQFYVNQPEYDNIRLIPLTYDPHRTCLGVTEPASAELVGILNQVIVGMSDEVKQGLIYKNTRFQGSFSLGCWMKKNPFQSIGAISFILACIIGILAWGLRLRTHMARRVALDMQKHMQVYEMADEHFFEYDYDANEIMVSSGGKTWRPDTGYLPWPGPGKNQDTSEQIETQNFIQLIRESEDGVSEALIPCGGDSKRWFRLTLKTICDHGEPACIIGKIADIDDEIHEKEQLRNLASRDSLTHLFNTEAFKSQVANHLAAMKPDEENALICLDIDHFKSINDTYGHMEGDKILEQVASLLQTRFSGMGFTARPGGDEFAVYLFHIPDYAKLACICEDLCLRVSKPLLSSGSHITCSVGAVLVRSGMSYENIYANADAALYEAKRRGRNGYHIST